MNEWPSVAEEEPVGSGSLVSSQFPSTRHTQYRNRVGRERFLHREPEVNLEGALWLLLSEGRIELKGTEQEGPAVSFEAPCGSRSRVILGTGLPTAAPLVSLSSRNHESPALGQVPGEASLAQPTAFPCLQPMAQEVTGGSISFPAAAASLAMAQGMWKLHLWAWSLAWAALPMPSVWLLSWGFVGTDERLKVIQMFKTHGT